jgi:anti-repressor protein
MEKDLIKIITNEKGQQCVSARELHAGLEVEQRFNDWIARRIKKYGFEENQDFTLVTQKRVTNNPKNPYTEQKDYIVTIDMAKELCMVENNDLGRMFRKYFIECEKRLKEVDTKAHLLLEIYNGGQGAVVATRELVELEKKPLLDKIEEQTPKANYYDKVLEPKDEENGFTKLITTTDIAKDLGMTARKLNEILNFRGVIYKQGKVWKVYAEYDFLITEKYCDYHITEYSQTLKWTEKGREWIINLLNN